MLTIDRLHKVDTIASRIIAAASRGVTTGFGMSRGRTVVAKVR